MVAFSMEKILDFQSIYFISQIIFYVNGGYLSFNEYYYTNKKAYESIKQLFKQRKMKTQYTKTYENQQKQY